MSTIDDELIAALQEDGRASYSALAARLGVSRGTVSDRLKELTESGRVRIVAAADPAFLGEDFSAHVSITGAGELGEVIERLRARDDIPLVSAISGAQDLVVEVRAADRRSLFDVLAWIRGFDQVARISAVLYDDILRGSFVSDYDGGGRIDAIDSELVELLRHDGRMSYRDLAATVRLSPTAVRERVRRMVDAGILRISAVVTHTAQAGRVKIGVGLHLGGDDAAVVEKLMSWPEVEFAALSIGAFDLVATLASGVPSEVFARLDELKGLGGVAGMETWFHLQTLKEDYSRAI